MLGYAPQADILLLERKTGHRLWVELEISRADPVANHANSEIHFAANPVEVLFNIHRWNADLNVPAEREVWGTRRVRYFAHDLAGNLFAPSKFAAFVRLPAIGQPFQHAGVIPSLTGMSLRAYADIDAALPIFDGRRAWTHLRDHLGFELRSLNDLPPQTVTSFWRWVETCRDAIAVDGKGAMVLKPSPP